MFQLGHQALFRWLLGLFEMSLVDVVFVCLFFSNALLQGAPRYSIPILCISCPSPRSRICHLSRNLASLYRGMVSEIMLCIRQVCSLLLQRHCFWAKQCFKCKVLTATYIQPQYNCTIHDIILDVLTVLNHSSLGACGCSYTGSCTRTYTQNSVSWSSTFHPVSVPQRSMEKLSGDHIKSPNMSPSLNKRTQQMALLQGCPPHTLFPRQAMGKHSLVLEPQHQSSGSGSVSDSVCVANACCLGLNFQIYTISSIGLDNCQGPSQFQRIIILNSFPLRDCNWLHLSLSMGINIPEGLSQQRDGSVGEVTASTQKLHYYFLRMLSSVRGLILFRQSGLRNFRPFFLKTRNQKIIEYIDGKYLFTAFKFVLVNQDFVIFLLVPPRPPRANSSVISSDFK